MTARVRAQRLPGGACGLDRREVLRLRSRHPGRRPRARYGAARRRDEARGTSVRFCEALRVPGLAAARCYAVAGDLANGLRYLACMMASDE